MLLHSRPATPLTDSLPRLETLVSPYTGIVRGLHVLMAAPDDARLIRIAATTADTTLVTGAHPEPLESGTGGWSGREHEARAAAIGEAAERYSGSALPESGFVLASAAELGPVAVDPERFALFSPRQHARPGFPFVPFRRDTRVRWVRGFSLPGGEETLLPVQLVYLTWGGAAGEDAIGYSTSSGLACGPTLEEAVLGGLLELVERDAFVLAWTNRLSLPLLDWTGDPELTTFETRYLARAGARHAVVDLSGFLGVPTALAVAEGDGLGEPAVAVGAGSAATIAEAVKKALAEAYAVRSWGRMLLASDADRTYAADGSDVVSFADHIRLYASGDRAEAARFLTASEQTRAIADAPDLPGVTPLEQIRELAARLGRAGVSAYAVDVTSPDVAAAGLSVAKVVAPELCPLDVRHDTRFLGGRRLYRAAFELGLAAAPLAWDGVNPDPHPFP
jgi:ribosomal protein S12 methylthiotransferase accessory factor